MTHTVTLVSFEATGELAEGHVGIFILTIADILRLGGYRACRPFAPSKALWFWEAMAVRAFIICYKRIVNDNANERPRHRAVASEIRSR